MLNRLRTFALPVAAVAVALLISDWLSLPGPLVIAMLLGAVVANSRWGQGTTAVIPACRTALRWGVGLLGLQLSFGGLVGLGLGAAPLILATVAVTFLATLAVGRWLRLEPEVVVLVAAGFSICGAAAIAATAETLRAGERQVAQAVLLVTIFGTLTIPVVPALAHILGLTPQQAAVWAGASIHEVAQVAVASSLLGGGALSVAMAVKLGRVVLLGPVVAIVNGSNRGRVAIPWFVVAFIVAIAVRSSNLLPSAAITVGQFSATVGLALGMFGLGLGMRLGHLRQLPARTLVLATVATLVAGGTSLALTTLVIT